jgi:hypothetical protein
MGWGSGRVEVSRAQLVHVERCKPNSGHLAKTLLKTRENGPRLRCDRERKDAVPGHFSNGRLEVRRSCTFDSNILYILMSFDSVLDFYRSSFSAEIPTRSRHYLCLDKRCHCRYFS